MDYYQKQIDYLNELNNRLKDSWTDYTQEDEDNIIETIFLLQDAIIVGKEYRKLIEKMNKNYE